MANWRYRPLVRVDVEFTFVLVIRHRAHGLRVFSSAHVSVAVPSAVHYFLFILRNLLGWCLPLKVVALQLFSVHIVVALLKVIKKLLWVRLHLFEGGVLGVVL